jgi:eukaryotic-like serine/threonine-protein kinase
MGALTAAERSFPPGFVLGQRYRIDRQIGSGSMGTVYAASGIADARPVALKVIHDEHASDPALVARFKREGRLISETRHPNIVEVVDLDQADGRWFLAMELLQGMNLADDLEMRKTYEPKEMVPVLRSVLDALEAAHQRQVVHRDLKPANVFLSGSPPAMTVKVLDFGIAKVVGRSAHEQLTRSGTVIGTPEFMSPEQALGTEVDARSDLYAVGCIAYTMLCGRPPFVDNWPLRVVMKQAFEVPTLPSWVRPDLAGAGGIDDFVARALAKKPAERFQSASEMRLALQALGG